MAERFVCVRIQSMNEVNIDLFQFDYDLTWMAFFMDAGDRFYARYGGRSDRGAESYLTKKSLLRCMRQVLALHESRDVQSGRYAPTGRPGRTPQSIPPMKQMLAPRKEACIHCHDVKNATLRHIQGLGRFSKQMIYTYPVPDRIGLEIDPDAQNRVGAVVADSAAERAGMRAGDTLLEVDGQRILTVGDFARVLQMTPDEASLPVKFVREGENRTAKLRLTGAWKQSPDPSWRSSTEVAGPNAGFWAVPLNSQQRRAADLPEDSLALRITFLFPDHPTPRRSGIKLGDVVVELDGDRTSKNIRQFHAYCQLSRDYGDRVPIVIRRGGQPKKLVLHLRDQPHWKE